MSTGHFAQFFTDDVTWTTIGTNTVVRGPYDVQDAIIGLHACMSDQPMQQQMQQPKGPLGSQAYRTRTVRQRQ
jgi:hypothetical protein